MRSSRSAFILAVLVLVPSVLPLVPSAVAEVSVSTTSVAPAFSMHPAPFGSGAAEPSIGVNWNTGNVMFQNWVTTYRVVFDDNTTPPTATWQNVRPALSVINVDPMLFTDHVTGRTFAGGLNGECSVMMSTDNDGQKWDPMGNVCASPAFDHQTIASGPWKEPRPATATYDRAVYYCAQAGAVQCARSDDGGVTFGPGFPLTCGFLNPGLHGSVHVMPNGNVWLPWKNGQGQICTARSTDNGQTWTAFKVPGSVSPSNGFDPDLASTPSNWLYIGYPSGGNAATQSTARVALTKDQGATWTISPDLGASHGLKVTTFHEMVAGDDQRAAMAFLGTTSCCVQQAFRDGAWAGVWHLYVAYTYDAGATWTTVRASDDPVQRGCIWDNGGSNACRNLLDFMDATVDQQGRVLVGFADGCRSTCATASGTVSQSRADWATIARQSAGRGLFAAMDDTGPLPLTVSAGGPYSGIVGGALGISGTATGGATPYNVQWSFDSRPSGSVAPLANANALVTTFTPDVAGTYTLRLTVTDAANTVQSATATLVASDVAPGTCGTVGVLVGMDGSSDGGGAGTASEVLCLRAADDGVNIHFYADLVGRATTVPELYYDFFFVADYAANTRFLIEGTWDGTTAAAYFADPGTFLPIPGKTVTAAMEGSTFHVTAARSEILSPTNGQRISGLYVDVNHCTGSTCTLVHDDYVPDAKNGQYTLGSTPIGGIPIPKCSIEVAADPANDALIGNRGIRDITRLQASDDETTTTFCVTVRDWDDRPTGVGQIQVKWDADYETGRPGYFVDVNVNADGTLGTAGLYKGGVVGLFVVAVEAIRSGNVLEIRVPKGSMGSPADGTQASAIIGSTGNDGSATANDVTSAGTFRFGQRIMDTLPPSGVTGLAVADLQTGSSLRLTWDAATDDTGVTSYVVRRATTSGGPYTDVATPTTTAFTDAGLTTNTTYHYVVAARDAADNVGPDSSEASGVPMPRPPDTTPPSVPTNLNVSGTESDLISISWLASSDPESGVTKYRAWRDGVLAGEVSGTTFTDTGLTPETTYLYEIAAVNGDDLESAKASILATTLPLPPPDCGQTGFELATDPDFDSANKQLRSDVVRVSLREDDRIWFHVGTRDMAGPQDPTLYRVVFAHAGTTYGVHASVADDGVAAWGVYTTVTLPNGGWTAPRTSQDVVARLVCDSILIGARPADIGNPTAGSSLSGLYVTATQNVSTNAVEWDRAPNAGGVDFVVGTSNLAPVLEPIGDQAGAEGSTLAFTLVAHDANGDPLSFSAASLPGAASFDESTGAFSWTPGYNDAATYTGIEFTVTDGKVSASETIDIVIANTDTTPTLQPIGDRTVPEGQTLGFTVLATEADGDAVTLSASGLPAGASFDPTTGAFSWTAPFAAGHAGDAFTMRFEATDGTNTAGEDVLVTVADVNRAPVLDPIGNRAIAETDVLTFGVSASDADGDGVTITVSGLPSGASFDGTTFSWATGYGDEGNHVVTFSASDGSLLDQETITISVGDVNRPPTIEPIADQVVAEGQALTLQVLATDPDADALSYASPNLPPGASLHATTGVLTWTPGYAQAGAYPNVQVRVTDGEDDSTATFTITVADTDRAPVVANVANLRVDETTSATRDVAASDPDGDALTLTALGLPSWATFTDNGDGTGRVEASPPAYAEGIYPVTLRATSNGLSGEGTFNVVVSRQVGVTVARVGPQAVVASPGQVVTLTATVTNTGTQGDTFDLTTSAPVGWTRTTPAAVTLEPGQATSVSWTVTVPSTGGQGPLSLAARSQASSAVVRSVAWTLSTPITASVTFDKPGFAATDEIRGVLRMTYADGSPVVNAPVGIEQTPTGTNPLLAPNLATRVSGTTNATGEWAFSFGADGSSRLPGAHTVRATYGYLSFNGGSYTVS